MAVTLSVDAVTYSGFLGTQTVSVTSAAFSPGAGTVIVVKVNALESFFSAWTVPTITDSLVGHLTWTLAGTQADATTTVGASWVFWAPCPSAQTNMTVTIGAGVGAGQYVALMHIEVEVVTGASSTTPIINITKGTHSGSPLTISITPTYTGSAVSCQATRTDGSGVATADVAGTGTLVIDTRANGGSSTMTHFIYGSAGPTFTNTTAGVAVSPSITTTDLTPAYQFMGYEIAPPAGNSYPRTAADTLAISDSAVRSALSLTRTAADSLVPSDAVVRGGLTLPRAITDLITLSDSASASVASSRGIRRGSWWALDSIIKTQAELVTYYRTQEPIACPFCGQPLLNGPPQAQAIKYCPWGHFDYPADYNPDTMSGM